MNDTCCMICKKKITYTGLKKHIFSNFHRQDIINAIHRKKLRYVNWLAKYESSPAQAQAPVLYFTDKENDGCYFCPVCKTIRPMKNSSPPSCGHMKETADFIKECLAADANIPQIEAPIVTSIDVEVKDKKIARLEKQLVLAKDTITALSDEVDAYYTTACKLHNTDRTSFNMFMSILKTNNTTLYETLMRDLEVDE